MEKNESNGNPNDSLPLQREREMLSLEDIQEASRVLLSEFAEICDANGFRYDIIGGSLLGAVRHHGFIPWDDDVDVSMPRPDYEKMLSMAVDGKLCMPESRQVISDRNCTFPRHFARYVRQDIRRITLYASDDVCPFMGIDIFPLDGVTGNDKKFQRQVDNIQKTRRLLLLASSRKGASSRGRGVAVAKDIVRPILSLYGIYRFARRLDKLCSQVDYETAEYVGVISGMYGTKERWPKEHMLPQRLYEFDGYHFLGYENYDEYLTNIYGDYMTLPPVDKQQPHVDKFVWA